MRAWYKPGHEPPSGIGRSDTEEGYAMGLKQLDTHDLKQLRSFWYSELKLLQNGNPLPVDLEVVQAKLQRLNAELEQRAGNP